MLETPRTVKRPGPLVRAARVRSIAAVLIIGISALATAADQTEAVPTRWESPVGEVRYAPGRGLQLPDAGVMLGGYSNLNLVRDEGRPAQLGMDDLSVLVTVDPTPRLRIFSEIEFEDLFQVDDTGAAGNPEWRFTAERLYADVSASDALNLRVGKFLTPVGEWNVIHAQPLVWTTSRPLATELPFDPHTTGVMVYGTFFPASGLVSYALYGQPTNAFDRVPAPSPADRGAGGRLAFTGADGWTVGTSYQSAEHLGDWRHLGGLDGLWRHGPLELMGEAVVENGARRVDRQWGLYLQGTLEVLPRLHLVGRYEHWERAGRAPPNNLAIGGVAWKPWSWFVLKAEYLAADHRAEESPPGFKSSIAILF